MIYKQEQGPAGPHRSNNMKYFILFVFSSLAIGCGLFPEDEVYRTEKSINDNSSSVEQQQISYWRTYGN